MQRSCLAANLDFETFESKLIVSDVLFFTIPEHIFRGKYHKSMRNRSWVNFDFSPSSLFSVANILNISREAMYPKIVTINTLICYKSCIAVKNVCFVTFVAILVVSKESSMQYKQFL